jgi:hypothetical protein
MDFLNKLLPDSRKHRGQLQTAMVAIIGIVATVALAWFFLRASDQSANILFANNGECPEITLRLSGDGRIITSSLKPGESEKIEVIPDVTYDFEVNHSSDPDEAGFSCLDFEPGQLTVPRGSTFTLNAVSQQRPFILLINDTECPEVTLTLWEAADLRANVDDVTLAPGEEAEIEITPDKQFEYRIRMDSDLEDDERCYEVESGTVNLTYDESEEVRISSLAQVEATSDESE